MPSRPVGGSRSRTGIRLQEPYRSRHGGRADRRRRPVPTSYGSVVDTAGPGRRSSAIGDRPMFDTYRMSLPEPRFISW